jgi:hypothetical protein
MELTFLSSFAPANGPGPTLLKNSFYGISRTKFVRKLLNVRSPWTLKFVEITALVPFSTATPDNNSLRLSGGGRTCRD